MKRFIVLLLLSVGSFSMAWSPGIFELYCGNALRFSAFDATFAEQIAVLADENNVKTQNYYDQVESLGLGLDPDVDAAEDCVLPARKRDFETWAGEILFELKALGFNSPEKRLGPKLTNVFGTQVIRLYAVPGYGGIAATTSPCEGGKINDSLLSFMRFNAEIVNSAPAAKVYYILAHEMVHMVQNAQPFIKNANDCDKIPKWLTEATADAVALYLVEKRFGQTYDPPISTGIGKNFHGLRLYSKNFAWESPKDLPQYRASSFFTFLAERYYGDDYSFIADFMKQTASGDDWFAWLD